MKDLTPEATIEDANTYFRMTFSVTALEALSWCGKDTPVSGDALMVYNR